MLARNSAEFGAGFGAEFGAEFARHGGDTARSSNSGNRAHAFRITVVEHLTPSKYNLLALYCKGTENAAKNETSHYPENRIKKY